MKVILRKISQCTQIQTLNNNVMETLETEEEAEVSTEEDEDEEEATTVGILTSLKLHVLDVIKHGTLHLDVQIVY